jgi:hypothetical protein
LKQTLSGREVCTDAVCFDINRGQRGQSFSGDIIALLVDPPAAGGEREKT